MGAGDEWTAVGGNCDAIGLCGDPAARRFTVPSQRAVRGRGETNRLQTIISDGVLGIYRRLRPNPLGPGFESTRTRRWTGAFHPTLRARPLAALERISHEPPRERSTRAGLHRAIREPATTGIPFASPSPRLGPAHPRPSNHLRSRTPPGLREPDRAAPGAVALAWTRVGPERGQRHPPCLRA